MPESPSEYSSCLSGTRRAATIAGAGTRGHGSPQFRPPFSDGHQGFGPAKHASLMSFAVNSFSNPPFLHLNRSANALLLRPGERPSDPGLQRAARLPFPREWLGRSLRPGAEINALSGRNFWSLVVQQVRGSLAERFKRKVYDLNANDTRLIALTPALSPLFNSPMHGNLKSF
jgi:hypothetical protein